MIEPTYSLDVMGKLLVAAEMSVGVTRRGLTYTADGVQVILEYKGVAYLVSVQPMKTKGDSNVKPRRN